MNIIPTLPKTIGVFQLPEIVRNGLDIKLEKGKSSLILSLSSLLIDRL